MKNGVVGIIVFAIAIAGVGITAGADTVSSFGPLPEATFGGSGIPNDSVAITSITDGGVTITLGLAAHGRFDNPEVTNDGNGTFFTEPGTDVPSTDPNALDVALWNFDFYAEVEGASFSDYQFDLFYDANPDSSTDFGILDFNEAVLAGGGDLASTTLVEGSQNLSFDFLFNDSLSFITAPSSPFDANATGLYSFSLQATRISDSQVLGSTLMTVAVVPVPAAVGLGFLGMVCVAGATARRRRNRFNHGV